MTTGGAVLTLFVGGWAAYQVSGPRQPSRPGGWEPIWEPSSPRVHDQVNAREIDLGL